MPENVKKYDNILHRDIVNVDLLEWLFVTFGLPYYSMVYSTLNFFTFQTKVR